MKHLWKVLGIVALALLVAPQANSTVYTLTDGNSTANVDTGSQWGMNDWVVDGTHLLYQQWFWYRVGNGAEASIDTLGVTGVLQPLPNMLVATFGSANGLQITLTYTMTGGNPGSMVADIDESIGIHNHSGASLDFHFFQYSDFDLNRTNLADVVRIDPSLRFVNQVPSPSSTGPILSETVLTGSNSPTRAEANYYANTRNSLNDGGPTTLNDILDAGPGDVTWAFQWDKVIAAGGSFIISKDKSLAPVPEPATLALLGGVMVLLARRLRKSAV
jgi:hypothetical protein